MADSKLTDGWECVIGLEVHAQIIAKSKLFSAAAAAFGAAPNSQVSLIDAAMPGTLPVLNKYCIEQAIKTGLSINARINKLSRFDRKNYFYADLPQGYQISQFYLPIVQEGYLNITAADGSTKTIRINRIHLEQDTGKAIHDQLPEHSLIDLNRAGIALMEIVTEPDISSPYEAGQYLKKLRRSLRCVGSCDGNMENGSLRCDANVSVRKPGMPLGTRCELKNINSIKNVVKAIEFEAGRQIGLLKQGQKIIQETRLFDAVSGETRAMRSKEDALDYRYFPDPDLLPVIIDEELIEQLKNELPELPDARVDRYIQELGLSKYDAEVIVADEEIANYFEEAAQGSNPKMIANWLSSELFARLNKYDIVISACKITPAMLRELVVAIEGGIISGKMAKMIFEIMFETGNSIDSIIQEKGLVQISDRKVIEPVIDEIIRANSESVAAYKNGKEKLFGFFVGLVMQKTNGRANPQLVSQLLKEKLSSE